MSGAITAPADDPAGIVAYWREAGPARWFVADPAFDAALRERFGAAHLAAAAGGIDGGEETPEGALALSLLLDQVPRNIYRGTAHAFATDPLSRAVAGRAVARGLDARVEPALRPFLYLPFEHSEDGRDQLRSLSLFEALAREHGDQRSLDYAVEHARIIRMFGRFPHRNRALGRETTAAERAFLDGGGFSG